MVIDKVISYIFMVSYVESQNLQTHTSSLGCRCFLTWTAGEPRKPNWAMLRGGWALPPRPPDAWIGVGSQKQVDAHIHTHAHTHTRGPVCQSSPGFFMLFTELTFTQVYPACPLHHRNFASIITYSKLVCHKSYIWCSWKKNSSPHCNVNLCIDLVLYINKWNYIFWTG